MCVIVLGARLGKGMTFNVRVAKCRFILTLSVWDNKIGWIAPGTQARSVINYSEETCSREYKQILFGTGRRSN